MQATTAPTKALGWPIQVAVFDATVEKNLRMNVVTPLQQDGASARGLTHEAGNQHGARGERHHRRGGPSENEQARALVEMAHDPAARRDDHNRPHDRYGRNAVEYGTPEQSLDRIEVGPVHCDADEGGGDDDPVETH